MGSENQIITRNVRNDDDTLTFTLLKCKERIIEEGKEEENLIYVCPKK